MKTQALIIEDNFELGNIFAEILMMMDIQTEIVRDGRAAVDRLKEVVPDIVFLDMHLPYVSGDQILNQIRADQRLSDTKVMIVSADILLSDQVKDKADGVFIKPISVAQVTHMVSQFRPLSLF